MDGQINMFDFWSRLTPQEEGKEVQMVSLMPEGAAEEATQAEELQPTQAVQRDGSVTEQNTAEELQPTEPVTEQEARADASQEADAPEEILSAERIVTDRSRAPVMHRESRSADGTILAEISYYNYNRICVKRQNEEPIWKNFDNAKDAVDFYIEEMMKL
jgi:hypothetical protein